VQVSTRADQAFGDGTRLVESSQADLAVKKGLKRVGMTTLGCKINSYESELIAQTLKTDNWQVVPAQQEADLYIINTCTVTKEADRQARQAVRKAIKNNPEGLVVVTGCYAQMSPQECSEIPGVDLVVGNDRKLDVHALLPQLQSGELPKVLVGDLDDHVSLPDQLLAGFDAHTRAFVQIQQGCNQGCTFCIIHVARGPSRSITPTLIKRQVQRLVLNGYPEIVLCGVDLGSYGEDLDSSHINLVNLIRELLELEYDADNPFRIRLSSIDPAHLTDELLDLIATEERITPHFHLSLQSGSTLILKRMKRRYDADHVRSRINLLREKLPQLVLSADVMVGFPTETEVEFQETLDMVQDLDICFPHVFSYSEREGTPAARIPQSKQVPVDERKRRNKRLRDFGDQLRNHMYAKQVGSSAWVLPERIENGACLARAEDYSYVKVINDPDDPNDASVETQIELGKWLKVHYQGTDGQHLIGFVST
jgi:threonylcarbamoyladenosine tRNA methylthiotransferase MtaB